MPVVKRSVEPIFVSHGEIPRDAKNGLEAVAVNTLSGVIYQLSSLAYHAENIFGELFKEATGIFERTCNAQKRIDQLAIKVTKLDSAEEESKLDIKLCKICYGPLLKIKTTSLFLFFCSDFKNRFSC